MRHYLFILFAFAFFLISCSSEKRDFPLNTIDLQIDSLLRAEMESRMIPGLTVAIIKKDQVIYKKAFGLAVVEHQVPTKIETVYELASLTKQFVAAGILLLVQDGKLALEDPIEKYLKDLPSKWEGITIRQLLSHTAGFAPQDKEFATLKKSWPKYVSKEMMMESAVLDSMYSQPGERFRYNNVGFFLACSIIEEVSQMDHRDYFQNRIFEPLKMEHTFYQDPLKITPHRADGYSIKDGQLVRIWRSAQEDMAGGWGLFSNIEDLIKWNAALDHHALLQPDFQRKMFEHVKLNNGQTFRYGLGWFLPERNGIPYYYHNGVTGTEILKVPAQDLTVILLSNLGNNGYDEVEPWGISDKLISEILFPDFSVHPKSKPISLAELEKFTGSYMFSYGEVVFTIKSGQLFIEDKYGDEFLAYLGDSTFAFLEYPGYFHFLKEDKILFSEDIWEDDYGYKIENDQ